MGKQWKQWQTLYFFTPKSLQMVTAAMKDAYSLEEKLWQPRQNIKKQKHYFAKKGPSSQSYGFSSSHVWMLELHYKKGWAPKNWWFWTVVLEKTLDSPLDCKEINPVHPKGDHSWIFIGRTDAETEVPILWPHDVKNWLIGKDSDAGKDWWQEEKGVTEDKIVGWHHQLNGHEFEHSRRWWRTGKPGVLQFTGLQRAIHNLVPEQQQPGKYGFALKQNLGSFIDRKFPPLIVVKNIWTHIYIMKWAVSERKKKERFPTL